MDTLQSAMNQKQGTRGAAVTKSIYATIIEDDKAPMRRDGFHNYLDTREMFRQLFSSGPLYEGFSLAATRIAPFCDNSSSPIMITMTAIYGAGRIITETPEVPATLEAAMVVGVGEGLATGLPDSLRLPEAAARKKLVKVVRALSSDPRAFTLFGVSITDQLVTNGESMGLGEALRIAVGDANWATVSMTPLDAMAILYYYAEIIMGTDATIPLVMLTNMVVATLKKGAATANFIRKINEGMQSDLGLPVEIVKHALVSKLFKAYRNYISADVARKVVEDWKKLVPPNALRLHLTVNQAVNEGLTAYTKIERAVTSCPSL